MSSHIQDKIDQFVMGQMSAEEQAIFAGQMKENPDLMRAVNMTRAVKQAVTDSNRAALHQQVTGRLRSRRRLPYILGGSILMVVTGIIAILIYNRKPPVPVTKPLPGNTPQPMALNYYHPPVLTGNLSSAASENERLFIGAKRDFENGKCASAAPAIRKLLTVNDFSERNIVLLMQGCCFLTAGNHPDSASVAFTTIINSGTADIKITEHAEWYLTLALLSTNPADTSAKVIVRRIAENAAHTHSAEAQQLLAEFK